jgi:hypothetical protein
MEYCQDGMDIFKTSEKFETSSKFQKQQKELKKNKKRVWKKRKPSSVPGLAAHFTLHVGSRALG